MSDITFGLILAMSLRVLMQLTKFAYMYILYLHYVIGHLIPCHACPNIRMNKAMRPLGSLGGLFGNNPGIHTPRSGTSTKYQQHAFSWKNKKST